MPDIEEEAPVQRIFTPLHHQLAWIWQDVLGCGRPSLQDDFFDAGGSSMLAVMLATRINEHFHTSLSALAVFEAPTFGQMAALVTAGEAAASLTARLWWDRPGPCAVYVPSAWGQDFGAPRFLNPCGVRALALRAPGLEPGEQPLRQFDDMVCSVLTRVDQARCGRFFLVGYSSGGVIALEAARRVRERSGDVMAVVLLDCGAPGRDDRGAGGVPGGAPLMDAILDLADQITRDQAHHRPRQIDADSLRRMVAGADVRPAADRAAEMLDVMGVPADTEVTGYYQRRLEVFLRHARAVRGRVMLPVDLPMIIVSADPAAAGRWRAASDRAIVLPTSTSHADLLSDGQLAGQVAAEIRGLL
jgi:thioesterase domain-containing protein